METKHNKQPLILGLTGPTGAGKSTASAALMDFGCAVIDADRIAREVVTPQSPCLQELMQEFGSDIVNEKGLVLRSLIAQRAFSDPQKTQRLNEITHPYITDKVHQRIAELTKTGVDIIVLDAPLLLESGEDHLCDLVIAVTAPFELRLERIMKRDMISREAALARMQAQKEESYYLQRADYVLHGDGSNDKLYKETAMLLATIREKQECHAQ